MFTSPRRERCLFALILTLVVLGAQGCSEPPVESPATPLPEASPSTATPEPAPSTTSEPDGAAEIPAADPAAEAPALPKTLDLDARKALVRDVIDPLEDRAEALGRNLDQLARQIRLGDLASARFFLADTVEARLPPSPPPADASLPLGIQEGGARAH